MRITCIADLHGHLPNLIGGDLLIVAGDLTARDTEKQVDEFGKWLAKQKYDLKVFIGGNHDGFLQKNFVPVECIDIVYLCDSGTEFEGLKIWGSPWTPEFYDWHFMKKRGPELKAVWDKIPDDVDILVTHGPPYGILDKVVLSGRGDEFKHAGCEELLKRLENIKPKLHVFGHIHSDGGKQLIYKRPGYGVENNTLCVNAAIMDEDYRPINKIINIVLT